MPGAPPGWYPDPAHTPGQPPTQRYWDGLDWTDHIAPIAASSTPAVGGSKPVATTPDGAPLAGWWWRALAYLIDSLIVGVAGTLASIPAQIAFQRDLDELATRFEQDLETGTASPQFGQFFSDMFSIYQQHWAWLVLPGAVVTIGYFAGMLRWRGATLGKLACGLQVRRRDSPGQLSWSTVATRVAVHNLAPTVLMSGGVLTGSIGLAVAGWAIGGMFSWLDPLWAAWDSKKQAIHDKAAKTNVIRTR